MPADPKPSKKGKPLDVPSALFTVQPKKCESCGKDIWFWNNPKTKKFVPVNRDGTSHFTTCDNPKRFSRRKSVADHFTTDVHHCPRCGAKVHEGVDFQALRRPAKDFQWWAPCPDTGEPMLLHSRKESE